MKKIRVLIIAMGLAFVIWNSKALAQIDTRDFLTDKQIQIINDAYEYKKNNEYDKAVQVYNQLCEKYPESFSCLFSKNIIAEMYYKAGEIKKANQIIKDQIARCDQEIEKRGESYYSALCLIMNGINYYSKKRYDDSLSEDEKNKLWEKAIQQLERILQYKMSDFKGTEDEFQLVQNFVRLRVAGYMTQKGKLERAEELLSQMPDDKKYGAGFVGADLINEYTKNGNWAKVAELFTKYRGQGRVPDISTNDYFYYEAGRKRETGNITEALEMLKSLPEPDSMVEKFIVELEAELRGEKPDWHIDEAEEPLYMNFGKALNLKHEAERLFDEGEYDPARKKAGAAQSILNEIKSKSPNWHPPEVKGLLDACEDIKTKKPDPDLQKEKARIKEIEKRGAEYEKAKQEKMKKIVLTDEEEDKLNDDFQKASLLIREARKELEDKRYIYAQGKAKKAHNILLDIEHNYPSWNSEAVENRREECKELFDQAKQERGEESSKISQEPPQEISPDTGKQAETRAIEKEKTEGPSEKYSEAYLLIREASKAIHEKNPDQARASIKSAQAILRDIKDKSPDWNPSAVEARLNECDNLLNTSVRPE